MGGRPAELLALRVLGESDNETLRAFFDRRLAIVKGAQLAEVKHFLGYAWVRSKEKQAGCLAIWRAARELDSALPVPQHYLKAYAEAYGSEDGLKGLR